MSTGDQSEYLRKKMAERRVNSVTSSAPSFMKSGFQRWAENERPTRMGGAEKEPLEVSRDGGRNILPELRKLGQRQYQKFYEMEGGAKHIKGDESESEEEMEGGRIMSEEIHRNVGAGLGKMALGEIGKQVGKYAAPILEPCEEGWKDEGVTCSKTVPKKVKKIGGGFKVQQQGQWWYVMDTQADGSIHVKAGPFKTKAEAEKAHKEENKDLSNKQPKREKKHKKDEDSESDDEEKASASNILANMKHKHGKGMTATSATMGHPKPVRTVKDGVVEGRGKLILEHKDSGHGNELIMGKGRISSKIRESKASILGAEGKVEEQGSGKKRSSARGELVKKIMREKGLSLPQASKYVKEHNLYKG